jgi:glucose-1-phosphate adenylyltransferase
MKLDPTQRYVSRLTHRTLAIVLAGGKGTRLEQLTEWRTKPAVPFGGNFRIIDFTLSNCINSGIRRIEVATQYKAHSLIRHIQRGWGFLRGEFDEFVELLPAQQRLGETWYRGTADAVYQNIDIIRSHNPEFMLVLAGDHIYKMDYGPMIARHMERDADVTIGCAVVERERASDFGVMVMDEDTRVTGFQEKPSTPRGMASDPGKALVSMGIYVFGTEFLLEQLIEDAADPASSHDFGHDIMPKLIAGYRAFAYPFVDRDNTNVYWRDVGTVDAFWEANLELTQVTPPLNLYDRDWPIWTYQEQLPPAKFVFDDHDRRGVAVNSMVSGGCVISGAQVSGSLLFCSVTVDSHTYIERSVVLPEVQIGADCRIRNAVIDQGCVIPPGTVIGGDASADAQQFHVTAGGITLVTPTMMGQVYSSGTL